MTDHRAVLEAAIGAACLGAPTSMTREEIQQLREEYGLSAEEETEEEEDRS